MGADLAPAFYSAHIHLHESETQCSPLAEQGSRFDIEKPHPFLGPGLHNEDTVGAKVHPESHPRWQESVADNGPRRIFPAYAQAFGDWLSVPGVKTVPLGASRSVAILPTSSSAVRSRL